MADMMNEELHRSTFSPDDGGALWRIDLIVRGLQHADLAGVQVLGRLLAQKDLQQRGHFDVRGLVAEHKATTTLEKNAEAVDVEVGEVVNEDLEAVENGMRWDQTELGQLREKAHGLDENVE